MQTFVSRDVLFHEFIFLFKSTSITNYMQPTPQTIPSSQNPLAYEDLFPFLENTKIETPIEQITQPPHIDRS